MGLVLGGDPDRVEVLGMSIIPIRPRRQALGDVLRRMEVRRVRPPLHRLRFDPERLLARIMAAALTVILAALLYGGLLFWANVIADRIAAR